MKRPRVILVFVDGLGLGPADPQVNPVEAGACPVLRAMLAGPDCRPIDARLGVPGVPQSATGQTTLLTGVNAAQCVGRHVEGFPGPALAAIVREQNIFTQLARRGRRATFANAYFIPSLAALTERRVQSVTTVAALAAFGTVRMTDALLAGEAVYQDLTRAGLRERGYTGPLATPAACAGDLARLAARHDFTLFEYFQTDHAGHSGSMDRARAALATLDAFLGALLERAAREGLTVALSSDHGNIEDLRTRTHTANPVPFFARGPGAAALRAAVGTIADVTPAVVALLTAAEREGDGARDVG